MMVEMEMLKPWHQKVQISHDLNTDVFDGLYEGRSMVNHRHTADFISRVYRADIVEKSMLDCGCNAGAHLYEAARYGIKKGLGFDARQHWINQAEWLKNNISIFNTDNIEFIVSNIYDIPNKNIGKFDVSMYSGLFYHVEEPFLSLKILSDVTNELLIVNTMYEKEHDQGYSKDCLYLKLEDVQSPLSGTHGVSWCPSGENVIKRMLQTLGFKSFYLIFKRPNPTGGNGRLGLAASKIEGMFDRLVEQDKRPKMKE
jgi:SAM-dependent methyltransferase